MFVKKILVGKIIYVWKKILSEKNFWAEKIFSLKEIFNRKGFWVCTIFCWEKILCLKNFCVRNKFWVRKNFGSEKYLRSKKYFLVMLDFANHPTTETQCQQYLSCYWPNFDEPLNVGSWEHLEQIPSVMATFVHIRNISTVTDPILIKL